MEEEWDLVNSLSSSLNIPERIEKSTSVELNFNRFANQPEFHIEDDGYPEDYDQQLMDEGVIFSDSPTPEDEIKDESMDLYDSYEEDINFTLGDSKLMDNDTVSDDVQRDNNELEQQRINQHKNIITSSFFPINNFMDKKDNSTRESEVDKQSLWEKNQAGPSVPYISSLKPFDNDEEEVNSEKMKESTEEEDDDKEKDDHGWPSQVERQSSWHPTPTQAGSSVAPSQSTSAIPSFSSLNFSFGLGTGQLPRKADQDIKQNFDQLESTLSRDNADSGSFSSTDNAIKSTARPIRQPKRRQTSAKLIQFTTESLPSFAAGPKQTQPVLSMEHLHTLSIQKSPTLPTQELHDLSIENIPSVVNIPPVEVTQDDIESEVETEEMEKDPELIVDELLRCFETLPEHEGQVTGIYLDIGKKYPDPKQWHLIRQLDLSRQNLTGLNDLAASLPVLEALDVSHNELKSISGLPASLCFLRASHNKLNEIDIYHLTQLQSLNLSHNFMANFEDMSRLKSLRSLDAGYNNIDSFKYFQSLTGLINLSLKSNSIRKLSGFNHGFEGFQLETLDISFNRIECLDSLETLQKLRELNANHNYIKCVQIEKPMLKLCKLKLSFNRLKSFDVSPFPDIRTLYLDDNQIERIIGMACVSKIDSFSMRDQGRQKVEFGTHYLRGSRKLYLSGSPFENIRQLKDFYSLETLELCAVGLEELPSDFGKMMPNLVNLYLSMNRLQDIRPLKRLKYLERLVLIDNRLLSINEVISVVKHLKRLVVLDLRQNPMCSNIYPALDLTLTQLSSENEKVSPYIRTAHDVHWEELEKDFRKDLSDHWRRRREVYRAYLIHECKRLTELDHIAVTLSERSQCDLVIESFQKLRSVPQQ